MKFVNKTKNSVQLEDINVSIPYVNDIPQFIDTQLIKKSSAFQRMVAMGGFEVIEASNERIEKNLFRISKSFVKQDSQKITRPLVGSKIEARLRGHFYESSGYSKVNRNLAISLYRNGLNVEIEPISVSNNDMNEIEAKVFSFLRKPNSNKAILIDSVIPTQGSPLTDGYSILYTTSESSQVPKQFIDTANLYNEVWVTSNFVKNSFRSSGCNKKITVVHPIVNKSSYNENVIPYLFRPALRSFVFLSVLTWDYRKGSDALLRAYKHSFSKKDDVSLVLLISEKSKSAQKQIRKEIFAILGEEGPHVAICTKHIPEYMLPSFYKACNVFVLPSRGEGFGLTYCESSLCGLPVISTNYGGQLDFLNIENSTLVDVDSFDFAKNTGIHYWDNQPFPSLKSDKFIASLGDSMRFVMENYEKAKSKNKKLQSYILENLSGEKIGFETKSILSEIWNNEGVKL